MRVEENNCTGMNEGKQLKKKIGGQSCSSTIVEGGLRWQRKSWNKGGKRQDHRLETRSGMCKKQKPVVSSSQLCSKPSISPQGSDEKSVGGVDGAYSKEYSNLFKIIRRSKRNSVCHSLEVPKCSRLCSGVSCNELVGYGELPGCCFEEILSQQQSLSIGFNTIQAIGLGIRLKELLK